MTEDAWAEHNARIKYEAQIDEIDEDLRGAVVQAGEALAKLGFTIEDAWEFISSCVDEADWFEPWREEAVCICPPELVARGGFKGGCPVHSLVPA